MFLIETFNCKGFKSQCDYIFYRLKDDVDVMCLSETWLRPNELTIVKKLLSISHELKDNKYSVFSKSGMCEADNNHNGRPYGGVTVICKEKHGLSYRSLDVANDRILCVGVYDKTGTLIQVVCNIYLPFYKPCDQNQYDEYISAIDALQGVIDTYGMLAPIKICGDFNCQLPCTNVLSKVWFREQGFTAYSKIVYDFLECNNFVVADFLAKQPVNYTYFSHLCNHYTWIDHIIVNRYDSDTVQYCKIMEEDGQNTSDHLPIRL